MEVLHLIHIKVNARHNANSEDHKISLHYRNNVKWDFFLKFSQDKL